MVRPSALLRRWLPVDLRQRFGQWVQRCRAWTLPDPYRTILPYTMVSLPRLRSLARLASQIDADGVPGDVVECGTCNGGSGALLASIASRSPFDRQTWLLDSFAGLPPPTAQDGPEAAAFTGKCRGQSAHVRALLARLGVAEDCAHIVPGWFQDTLPTLPAERIALLHIDADWHDSVLLVLRELYSRVVPGGFVVLDDYGYWQGCRLAWEEFRASERLEGDLVRVDGIGVYFRKPTEPATGPVS